MLGKIKTLARCNKGATAIEYGLIASLIVVALVSGLSLLGSSSHGAWGNVASRVAAVEP